MRLPRRVKLEMLLRKLGSIPERRWSWSGVSEREWTTHAANKMIDNGVDDSGADGGGRTMSLLSGMCE